MKSLRSKIGLSIIWLVLCVALAAWWRHLALGLVDNPSSLATLGAERLRNMLLWESTAWLALLLIGGTTLIYLIIKEHQGREALEDFVAAFSHDIKTSMASLLLLAESIHEDAEDPSLKSLSARLLADSNRLQIQIENSLFLANFKNLRLFLERVPLEKILDGLRQNWPQLEFCMDKKVWVKADLRALESIFRNVVHNAVTHGGARRIELKSHKSKEGRVELNIKNDGVPFEGETKKLGRMFYRQNPSSGSGLGLFLVKELASKMDARAQFDQEPDSRLTVKLEMVGGML